MTKAELLKLHPWLDGNDYPFKNHFFRLPMGNMHYVDEGKGEPIVMVHGNPAWGYEFRHIIREMSKTHRCIVPDHIGFGLSDKPSNWSYLPILHAQNLEALLDSLNLKNITLVVNDWGGPIGLSYAINHPTRIKKLVILNTWLWSVEKEKHFEQFSRFMGGPIGRFLTRNFNFFGKVVVKKAVGNPKNLSSKVHKHYYKHMQKPSERKGSYVFPKEIIGSSQWLNALWMQKDNINQISTHFVWGMKDIAFRPLELKKWLDNWHHYKLTQLPDSGHFPQEEAPEAVIKAIQEG